MAKRGIKEVNDNKKWFGRYTAFLAGDILQFKAELAFKKSQELTKTPTGEEVRWSLVPIVSIFESFYKEIFARYIDSGEPYLSRAEKLNFGEKRLDISTLVEISKKSFTTGELIAYSLPYNSFNQIRNNYEALCACDYVEKIRNSTIELQKHEQAEFERARERGLGLLNDLENVFRLRHTLVHEYPATNVSISIDQALSYFDSAWLLLMATDRLFWADTGLEPPIKTNYPI